MLNQLIELLKRTFIQQELDALARGQLAGRVLLLDACGAAALLGLLFAFA